MNDIGICHAISELLIELYGYITALNDYFLIAKLTKPVFCLCDDPSAQSHSAIIRQHNDPAEHGRIFIKPVKATCRNRKTIVGQNDILCFRSIMFVKFPAKGDAVLFCHPLNSDIVGTCLLPRLRCPDHINMHCYFAP